MPFKEEYVDPEVRLEHRGVKVYCAYKNDNVDNGVLNYEFHTAGVLPSGNTDYSDAFDVREFSDFGIPTFVLNDHPPFKSGAQWDGSTNEQRDEICAAWRKWHEEGERAAVDSILKAAIDAGVIGNTGDFPISKDCDAALKRRELMADNETVAAVFTADSRRSLGRVALAGFFGSAIGGLPLCGVDFSDMEEKVLSLSNLSDIDTWSPLAIYEKALVVGKVNDEIEYAVVEYCSSDLKERHGAEEDQCIAALWRKQMAENEKAEMTSVGETFDEAEEAQFLLRLADPTLIMTTKRLTDLGMFVGCDCGCEVSSIKSKEGDGA